MKDTITSQNFFLYPRGIHAGVESITYHDRIGGATMIVRTRRKDTLEGTKEYK